MENDKIKVFIIGAGIAGIACAHRLLELNKNYDITIFEASDRYGGRLRSLKDFSNFAIELGGEEIHGDKTLYYELVKKSGGKIFGYWEKNIIYTQYKGELVSFEDSKIDEITKVKDFFEDISYEFNKDYEDITLREFLVKNNFSKEVYHMANAMIGVEVGTDLDKASVWGFSDISKRWQAGEDNFLISNMSHMDVVEKSFPESIKKIKLNVAIKNIDYSEENKVILTDANNNNYFGNKCILTVPITQLRKDKITFTPKFTKEKQTALDSIQIDATAKLILKFKKKFWSDDTCWILVKGNVNCYWPTAQGKDSTDIVLSALVTGQGCSNLALLYKKSKDEFITDILNDLQIVFKLTHLKSELIDFYWHDWTTVPYIEGGYTFPSVKEGNAREIAKKSISNKIFFAGEAFAKNGHIATIHGALESGFDTADELDHTSKSLHAKY